MSLHLCAGPRRRGLRRSAPFARADQPTFTALSRASPPAPGVDAVRLPGEAALRPPGTAWRRVWRSIRGHGGARGAAQRIGVAVPEPPTPSTARAPHLLSRTSAPSRPDLREAHAARLDPSATTVPEVEETYRARIGPTAVGLELLTVTLPPWRRPRCPTRASLQRQLDQLQPLLKQQQQDHRRVQRQPQQLQGQQTQSQQAIQDMNKKSRTRQAVAQQPVMQAGRKTSRRRSRLHRRAVNIAADDKNPKAYFVDDDDAYTRFRLDGTYGPNKEAAVGATVKVAVHRTTTQVSPVQNPGDSFDERKVEGRQEQAFRRPLPRQGDPSAKDIARIDLSDTDLLAYASVSDITGASCSPRTTPARRPTSAPPSPTRPGPPEPRPLRRACLRRPHGLRTYGATESTAGRFAGPGGRWLQSGSRRRLLRPEPARGPAGRSGSGWVLNIGTRLSLTFAAGEQIATAPTPTSPASSACGQTSSPSAAPRSASTTCAPRPGRARTTARTRSASPSSRTSPSWARNSSPASAGTSSPSARSDPDNIFVDTVGAGVSF